MNDSELLNFAKSVLSIERKALENAENLLGNDFLQAVKLILNRSKLGRIAVMGIGKSGHIGNKIAATLASTGTPAFFVHPAEAGHGDLGMITANDIVLAISQSGNSEELLKLIPYFKRNGIELIVMTGNLQSPLAKHANVIINTVVEQEACPLGLAPTASTTLILALGDALAVCLLKSKGFTALEFASTHPHGTLGRKLLVTISEIMLINEAIPVVNFSVTLRTAIIEMSRASLGFVNITDNEKHILGIFTDGDLRRALDNEVDVKKTTIDKVMSNEFIVAYPHQLAVEAVELMEKFKISAIPIVNEEKKIVGAINMRMLLQAGVV
jgi:arabinose-5-phosphate isomerase